MPFLLLLVLVALAVIALTPIAIVQRFRRGATRQRARGWLSIINIAGLTLSSALFLISAAVTSIWVPDALTYTAAGLGGGVLLGLVGLLVTRWEPSPGALYYTPNRWLLLAITLVVAARVLYGLYRVWATWNAGLDGSWAASAGLPGAMGAGAVVLGYYLAYWIGVRRRFQRARR